MNENCDKRIEALELELKLLSSQVKELEKVIRNFGVAVKAPPIGIRSTSW